MRSNDICIIINKYLYKNYAFKLIYNYKCLDKLSIYAFKINKSSTHAYNVFIILYDVNVVKKLLLQFTLIICISKLLLVVNPLLLFNMRSNITLFACHLYSYNNMRSKNIFVLYIIQIYI